MTEGTEVRMIDCLEADVYKDRVWIVKSEHPFIVGGDECVLLDGFSGAFSCEFLEEI